MRLRRCFTIRWIRLAVLSLLLAGFVHNTPSALAAVSQDTFKAVSSGQYHNCGIKSNDVILCWGGNADGQSVAPAGAFKSVSAVGQHSCALHTTDTIQCWGNNQYGQSSPPTGKFKAVGAGDVFA